MYLLDHRLKKLNLTLTLTQFIDTHLNYYSFGPVYPEVTVVVGTMSQ